VATGSHIDTQPTGGKFDGNYGVLAGLEVLRTLNDHGVTDGAPIEVCVWTNEEGSRFVPVMMGSGVWAGAFSLEHALSAADREGVTVRQALQAIGYAGPAPAAVADGAPRFGAYFEAHIEQGPVLEASGRTIGVVTGALGPALVRRGRDRPGGPCRPDADGPAPRRAAGGHAADAAGRCHRPRRGAACTRHRGLCRRLPQFAQHDPGARHLHGRFPPHRRRRAAAHGCGPARRGAGAAGRARGVEVALEPVVHFPPAPFTPELVARVRAAAERQGLSHQDIVSGAGHDAVYVARQSPTAMIFVPCRDGISHNEIEDASPEHLAAGAQVLLEALLETAGQAGGVDEDRPRAAGPRRDEPRAAPQPGGG
jgi:N-carbamoyl-L-amino-acid hydrolase